MSVVANVAINVDGTAAERALKNLGGATDALQRKFDDLPSKLGAGLQNLGGKISGIGKQLSGLGGIMAGLGASAAVGGFVRAGIEADRTAKTINALAGSYGETAKLTNFANESAKRFGLGQTQASRAVADLYGRLRPMGISLTDIQKTFTGVNNAAARMNLTAADTDGVMLQLSQAMGSGALQGDELRSVMERLPAVGQAIAKVMGVPVSQIKQLGADGKITTDIIVKAMNELSMITPPPPDAYKQFQAALADLNTTIGQQLLPVFTPLVQKLSEMVARFRELGVASRIATALRPIGEILLSILESFMKLPAPAQELIIQIGVLAGAFALIAAPLGLVLQGVGALVSAIGSVIGAIKGLSILAGIIKSVAAIGSALLTLGKILIAVFSGPAGWIALVVAAGVAIYAFRDQIGDAFKAIGKFVAEAAQGFYKTFIEPVIKWNKFLYDGMIKLFSGLANALRGPFNAVATMIRGVLNVIISAINRQISSAVNAINFLVRGANAVAGRLRLPMLPYLQAPQIPMLAQGGIVTKPTLAMIGEGGEPEVVLPLSKAAAFAENFIGSNSQPVRASTPAINITTGPVMQQDGQRYVTLGDMESAMQAVVGAVLGNGRTVGGRRYAGVA